MDESPNQFYGSVMKLAETGVDVEFATKFKFVAKLFPIYWFVFNLMLNVSQYLKSENWVIKIPYPRYRSIPVEDI